MVKQKRSQGKEDVQATKDIYYVQETKVQQPEKITRRVCLKLLET